MKKVANKNLQDAKRNKNDEFYTRYEDIEKEITHYKEYLKDKWVYSSCDDYRWSEFKNYFVSNFTVFGLKHYTCTCIDIGDGAYRYDYNGEKETITKLEGNGDFRSEECIELLKECDVVVTNPPFSLFREYVVQLMEYGKKFLIIGPQNAVTYKDIFPYIKNNKLWLGTSLVKDFVQPNGKIKKFGNIRWYTNITHQKRNTPIDLYKEYNEVEYPKYENYDAINVNKTIDIPMDYEGAIGVPITFLDKYCPTQFKIIGLGIANLGLDCGVQPYKAEHREYRKNIQKRGVVDGDLYMVVNGEVKVPYARILIKKIV